MRAFQFTLEAVQVVRQRQENEALEQYALALLSRQQAVDMLQAIEQRIREDFGHFLQLIAGGCTGSQAAQAQNFRRSLEKKRDEAAAALSKADQRASAAYQTMLAARQQREVVDTYRKKQQTAYHRAAAREEQKALDEFALRRVNAFHSSETHATHE